MPGRTAPALSLRALNRATLARQMLLRREKLAPVAALERLVALQAQLARPPFIGLWSRIEGFRREDLVRAVGKRLVVRGTMMRATLHLLSRRDYLAFRPVLQSALAKGAASVLGRRADGIAFDEVVAAARACFEERPRTFAALRDHMKELFPRLDERAIGHIVRLGLPLIQTPGDAAPWAYPGVADFAVAESWLRARLKDGDRPHALALRYFAAFGPASVQDLQAWTGIAAASVVEELRPKLRTFRDERGRELFDVKEGPLPAEDEVAPVRFLPEFDNALLGYSERARIISDEHRRLIFTKNLLVPATFLVDGFVAGKWAAERKRDTGRLLVRPFGALARRTREALAEEGERLLQFVEADAASRSVVFAKPGA
jgi:hypothetical protein